MIKTLPISENIRNYFTDPCPVLSDNTSQIILEEIAAGYDWVVEYGLGASTLFFLNALYGQKTTMISVENNIDWFNLCVTQIASQTDLKQTSASQTPWSLNEIYSFVSAKPKTLDAPEDQKRLARWQAAMTLGPFAKIGACAPMLKPFLSGLAKIAYTISPNSRPQNAEWIAKKESFSLILRNVPPTIKDQLGEAPNSINYINAGLKDIRTALENGKTVKAAFIIDGGPRHVIIEHILALEEQYPNFQPTIILCDAHRRFYAPTLAKRPNGRFIAGTNRTLKGAAVASDVTGDISEFWVGNAKTADELAQQEIWVYKKP